MKSCGIKGPVKKTGNLLSFVNTLFIKIGDIKKTIFPVLLRSVLFLCGTIFLIWAVKREWHLITNLDTFKVSPSTFSIQTPAWMKDRFTEDIKNIAGLRATYGLYEENLTQEIANIYDKVAVIKKVDSIERIFPNRLHIKLILRKPVALVKNGRNTYLVDDEGVLLPKEYYVLPNPVYNTPYIQSKKLSRPPLYGRRWKDKRVRAGVELIKFLKANNIHNLFSIVAVDVTNVCKRKITGKSDIVLWTENNTQIWWGCSALCKTSGELSDEEKLQNLLSVAKVEGTSLRRMEYVDVRWKTPLGKHWTNTAQLLQKY